MINKEQQVLAKKLKKAGYPQKRDLHLVDMKWITYPTLDDLIEECGDSFEDLMRVDDEWDANATNIHTARGETPYEAVVNLYVALQQHV